ncbi:MAG: heparan-alpha-glucosaminide N-acetyltransferase domain-containing protein [Oscillospiraceae bacterium]
MGSGKKRIAILDETRGFAVFCMIFYHAFVIYYEFFNSQIAFDAYKFFEPVQPIFAAGFIFISGICTRLSHNNAARGLKLLCIAVALTFVSAVLLPTFGFQDTAIYFGVLHLLAVSMLLFAVLQKPMDKIPATIGAILCIAIVFVTREITVGRIGLWGDMVYTIPNQIQNLDFLFPLGIESNKFFSADYFPIFPWSFVFLFGSFVGISVKEGKVPAFAYKSRVKFFDKIGKNALLIYIVHIPILYILGFAIQWLLSQI